MTNNDKKEMLKELFLSWSIFDSTMATRIPGGSWWWPRYTDTTTRRDYIAVTFPDYFSWLKVFFLSLFFFLSITANYVCFRYVLYLFTTTTVILAPRRRYGGKWEKKNSIEQNYSMKAECTCTASGNKADFLFVLLRFRFTMWAPRHPSDHDRPQRFSSLQNQISVQSDMV